MARVAIVTIGMTDAHEFLGNPLARTSDCLLNAVVMGNDICHYARLGLDEDTQCPHEESNFAHLFHLHTAYDNNACGGSILVHGSRGTQGLLQNCGDIKTNPQKFDMSLSGLPVTQWVAGSEVDLKLQGFFHEGVMRAALCFHDDGDCNKPSSFDHYVLGYHFTEGTAGAGSDIYGVELNMKVKLPNRNGRAVIQWLVDAEDVRSYVSCSDVMLSGATVDAFDEYVCNGHPLCNCTLASRQDDVGLGRSCPRGTAPSVTEDDSATGTDIVKQWKDQLGVEEFCALCITDGCPSTCGGKFKGYYQGDKCTNTPVIAGCGNTHESGLPRFITCSKDCQSSNWFSHPASPDVANLKRFLA